MFKNINQMSTSYLEMLRFIPESKQEELNHFFNQEESQQASNEFLRNWSEKNWSILLSHDKSDLMMRGALTALKNGQFKQSDYCTYSLFYAAFIEFIIDQIVQARYQISESRIINVTSELEPFNQSPSSFIFTSSDKRIKNYFHLTKVEWDAYCDIMQQKDSFENQYLSFPLPLYGTWSCFYERLTNILKIGRIVSSKNLTKPKRECIVPSWAMINAFYLVKSRVFGRSLILDPIIGPLEEKDVEQIKRANKIPVGLIHPNVEDYKEYISNQQVDGFSDVRPYTFAFHDAIFHAFRELLANPHYEQIRNRWITLFRDSDLPNSDKIAQILIDGEGPVNYFNDEFYNHIDHGIHYWLTRIKESTATSELNNLIFKDIIWNGDKYANQYHFTFEDLSIFRDDFLLILQEETPKILESRNLEGLFTIALSYYLEGGREACLEASELFKDIAEQLNSGAAYFYQARSNPNKIDFEETMLKAVEAGYLPAYDYLAVTNKKYIPKSLKNIFTINNSTKISPIIRYSDSNTKIIRNGEIVSREQMALNYFPYYLNLAHRGNFHSCLIIAEIYLHIGIKNDSRAEKIAFKWAKRASPRLGSPVSYRFLGDMYRLGIGTARNYKKARNLYKKAELYYKPETDLNNLQGTFVFSNEQIQHEKKILPELIKAVSGLPSVGISTQFPSPIFLVNMVEDSIELAPITSKEVLSLII